MTLSVSGERRVEFSNQIMKLLDSWGTTGDDKIVLLGLPKDMRTRKLEKYRRDEAFPDTEEVNEHLEHLVGIADALRTTFPRNVEMCAIWIRKPERRFDNQTPIELMIRKGLPGIIRVRAHLDCSFAWNASGSKA